jgi:hypothetical protein
MDMNSKLLMGGILAIAAVVFYTTPFCNKTEYPDFQEKRAMVAIRNVGHEILLQSGDLSSRVLPVKKMSDHIFQLEFEAPLSFATDSLIKIVQANLSSANLPSNYMVSVLDARTGEMVYGYELGPQHNIVPCRGRAQPKSAYLVQVGFTPQVGTNKIQEPYYYYLLVLVGITLFAFAGSLWIRHKNVSFIKPGEGISIGKYKLCEHKGVLMFNDQSITLSDKEEKLLRIFANNQNKLIERDALLKEVWEDEGVFTGRSLDVFISRLRKKLQNDVSVQIINIHGRGYKLETKIA